jgi:transposase-like protein
LGEGETDVSETTNPEVAETNTPDELEHQVAETRENVTDVVRELDRRWHALADWRHQLRQHSDLVAIGAVIAVGGTGLWMGVNAWRERKRRKPLARVEALRDALLRMMEHPEAVVRSRSSLGRKFVTAAGSTVASLLIKELVRRYVGEPRESSAYRGARST